MTLADYLSKNIASKLASEIGISNAYLSQIKNGDRSASARLCVDIERATLGAVTCEELRPDVDWTFLRGTTKSKSSKKAA